MTTDAYTLLIFIAGVFAGLGLALELWLAREAIRIVRLIPGVRRSHASGGGTPAAPMST